MHINISKYDIVYASRSEHFNLVGLGDIHLGSVGFDERKLLEIVDWIKKTPRTYWIGTGDYCECINPSDKRFDPYSISPSYKISSLSRLITTQIEDISAILRPIKKKCIAFVVGNHEETIRLKYNYDVGYQLQKELNAPCLGYDGWVRLRFSRKSPNATTLLNHTVYHIYITHGHCGAGKSGAKVNKLEDVATFMDADIIMMGHGHKKVIAPPVLKLGLDKEGNLTTRKQVAVMCGSFLKCYVENSTTYGEKKCYSPCDLGVVKIMLKPDIHDIHASL